MPVPLPGPDNVLLVPPDFTEANDTARAIGFVVAPAGGMSDVQRILLGALYVAMTGHDVDLDDIEPITAPAFAELLARRTLAFRTRGVQVMLLCALVLRPLPPEVATRISEFASELGVDEAMVGVAQEFAAGSLGLAAVDFERNGYTSTWAARDATALHTSSELQSAWDSAVDDSELAARWGALRDLAAGTVGRGVWEMYRARGFEFPGLAGSAPPLLAQHDWVHVLADYGTTVESELEVFALIARANDDMHAFSLLAMVVSLFETGYLQTGAGLFEASPGHLSAGHQMAVRVADAMRRGALCHDQVTDSDSIDFLRLDWFDVAPLTLGEARARFGLTPKSSTAVAAGSIGPWEPGGISPFQAACGRSRAERESYDYDSYGASPAT